MTDEDQSVVGVNSYVAHANRAVFGADADLFRPERWLQELATTAKMENYFFTVGYPFPLCVCVESVSDRLRF